MNIKKIIAGFLMVAMLMPSGNAFAGKGASSGKASKTIPQGNASSGKGVVANREAAARLVRLFVIIGRGGRGTVVEAPTPKPKPKDEPAKPKTT